MDVIVFLGEQWILVSAFMALLYLFVWTEQKKGGQRLSPHQAVMLQNQDMAIVLDVRDAADFKAGHITDAINIPFAKLKERLGELDKHKEKTIIVVDKMGQHSGTCGKDLLTAGFTAARLQGGMSEWDAQKLPVIKG